MKNFKQIFAIVFTLAVVAFGIIVMIDGRDGLAQLGQLKFDAENWKLSMFVLIIFFVDVMLIALPAIAFVLVLTNKLDPFKAIVDCAIVTLAYFLLRIFVGIILLGVLEAPAEVWKEYFFGKDSLAIIPSIVFIAALAFLFIGKASDYEGTLVRAVLSSIGAALATFGLVFYFILGGAKNILGDMGKNPDWITITGLVIGIACFAGIIVYSFLPQTREFGNDQPKEEKVGEPKPAEEPKQEEPKAE